MRSFVLRVIDLAFATLYLLLTFAVFVSVCWFSLKYIYPQGFRFSLNSLAEAVAPIPGILAICAAAGVTYVVTLLSSQAMFWTRLFVREPLVAPMRQAQVARIADGELDGDFVLFLHSFDFENKMRRKNSRVRDLTTILVLEAVAEEAYDTLLFIVALPMLFTVRVIKGIWRRLPIWKSADEFVADALWPDKLLVSVGGAADRLGTFGALPLDASDDEWREYVADLAADADAIIIAPGPTEGIVEEVARIASDPELHAKAIFLWPHGLNSRDGPHANALAHLRAAGYKVPAFDEKGALFNLSGESVPLVHALNGRGRLRKAISRLSGMPLERMRKQRKTTTNDATLRLQ